MTPDFRPHPIAMEPARAAARERWARAPKGERTARLRELRDLTTEALIWDRSRRDG